MFFILPFSTSLVRRRRRAFFCYFRPAESNGEAAGGFAQAPGPPTAAAVCCDTCLTEVAARIPLSLSLPCAKGGESGGPVGIVFFILPFSTSLVRLSRRAFFCYFRLPESNQRAPGALRRPPVPPPRQLFAVMLI